MNDLGPAMAIFGLGGLVSFALALSAITISYLRRPRGSQACYKDQDGIATEESILAYAANIPKTLPLLLSTLGLIACLALTFIDNPKRNELTLNCLILSQWFFFQIQSMVTFLNRASSTSYTLGLFLLLSSGILFALLVYEYSNSTIVHSVVSAVSNSLRYLRMATVVAIGFCSLCIPRRPDVFHDGKIVTRMYTSPAIKRYTFSWLSPLLDKAYSGAGLEYEDFPALDHGARSKELHEAWESWVGGHSLWISIFLAHKRVFFIQYIMTIFHALGVFAPQFVIFRLLKILETRQPDQKVDSQAWFWVLTLALVTIGSCWADNWLYWISWSQISLPIRSQLGSLIFQKSLRRKDIKGSASYKDKVHDITGHSCQKDDSGSKTKQSTVNLLAIDAKRVADFTSLNNYYFGALLKATISFTFLLDILGWQPLVAGIMIMGLTIPPNIFYTRQQTAAQRRLSKIRDVKTGIMTEGFQGIRQIKLRAMETNWQQKIGEVREQELKELWSVYTSIVFVNFCWIVKPIALSATALAVYSRFHGTLTPSVAFTAIGIFNALESTLGSIPELIRNLIESQVSVRRIEEHLHAPEVTANHYKGSEIAFQKANIAWPSEKAKTSSENRYVLRNISLLFPMNELSVISGKTGSGKSLLLSAILGEADVLYGKIHVPTPSAPISAIAAEISGWIVPYEIAYVAQIPWIQNATIKDNILFGLPFHPDRYEKVLFACALKQDLHILPDGDETEVGSSGINLSGGQKWRVAFGRALYSRAGILILDDIFSAVDTYVGRFLFENGVTGELGWGRTRILVTHHFALVKSRTTYFVQLGDGTVTSAGTISGLVGTGEMEIIEEESEDEDTPGPGSIAGSENDSIAEAVVISRLDDTFISDNLDHDLDESALLNDGEFKKPTKKFVEVEKKAKGRIGLSIYLGYLNQAGSWRYWGSVLMVFLLYELLITGRSWWLRIWTGHDQHESPNYQNATTTTAHFLQLPLLSPAASINFYDNDAQSEGLTYYLGIYVAISVITAIVGTFNYWVVYTGSIRASRSIFNDLSFTVLRTPLRWVDTVPLGRILNRFTTDFEVTDSRIPTIIVDTATYFFRLWAITIAGTFVSPYVLLISGVILAICVRLGQTFICAARDAKRLESNARSPMFEHYGSVLSGIVTVRAFNKHTEFISKMENYIDTQTAANWHVWAFTRWLGLRMGLVGALFSTLIAVLVLLLPNIDASLAGFALLFALQLSTVVIWTIRNYSNIELSMNAIERILEYTEVPIETQDGINPPAAWPYEGRIEVNKLVATYDADLPPVLKGLTFTVENGERVGVVGRTGAGKSSLTYALFRVLEAVEGTILIDGVDISKIRLKALRSRLSIIPQDPVLFSGTIRSNLDALGHHSDSELRDALERVHLITSSETSTINSLDVEPGSISPECNINPFSSLSTPVTEGGLNLSQGQRQLLCLARAIISRPKILILDEATSAVDMVTDQLIQRSIREEFQNSTLLVIAHRINTILDFDKILVLDQGKAVEFGSPDELLAIDGGVFKGLVEEGERRN